MTGFHVDKHTLKITQLWSSVYASPGVEVLALAARNPAEHVYSQAKVSNTRTLVSTTLHDSIFAYVASHVTSQCAAHAVEDCGHLGCVSTKGIDCCTVNRQ